ncbi:unnamed protein product [Rangifer tarandus platyrhynchus]|uniref:Uncharacterized protein n=1 Tax=Rangifer tarandus platyrhynchus TaxID=3082113 RepID=A0ABN8ZMT2_RANTA|nr:unnamed protein product [Rangifer tarandus platyrhynchus]
MTHGKNSTVSASASTKIIELSRKTGDGVGYRQRWAAHHRGDPRGKVGARLRSRGILARRGWDFGHSASQRPERRKRESEPEKRGQRPDARERQEGWEGERAGEERSASCGARRQPPRLQGPRHPRTPPGSPPRWALPRSPQTC